MNVMINLYLQMNHGSGSTLTSDAFGGFSPLSGRGCSACLAAALRNRSFPSVQFYWIAHRESKWAGAERRRGVRPQIILLLQTARSRQIELLLAKRNPYLLALPYKSTTVMYKRQHKTALIRESHLFERFLVLKCQQANICVGKHFYDALSC